MREDREKERERRRRKKSDFDIALMFYLVSHTVELRILTPILSPIIICDQKTNSWFIFIALSIMHMHNKYLFLTLESSLNS